MSASAAALLKACVPLAHCVWVTDERSNLVAFWISGCCWVCCCYKGRGHRPFSWIRREMTCGQRHMAGIDVRPLLFIGMLAQTNMVQKNSIHRAWQCLRYAASWKNSTAERVHRHLAKDVRTSMSGLQAKGGRSCPYAVLASWLPAPQNSSTLQYASIPWERAWAHVSVDLTTQASPTFVIQNKVHNCNTESMVMLFTCVITVHDGRL